MLSGCVKSRFFILSAMLLTVFFFLVSDISATTLGRPFKRKQRYSKLFSNKGLYSYTDTRHQFTVYAPTRGLAKNINKIAEGERKKVYRFFNCTRHWGTPAIIKIYPSKMDYEKEFLQEGSLAAATQLLFKGKKARLIVSFAGKDLTKSVISHEIVHLLISDLANEEYWSMKETESRVPLWVNEGMAEFISASNQKKNKYKELTYAAMVKGLAYPVRQLIGFSGYPQKKILFYAQSYCLVAFLARVPHGPVKLRNYITTSNQNVKNAERRLILAFHSDYRTIQALKKSWRRYIQTKYAKPEDKWSASTLVSLGWMYLDEGRFNMAITYANKAMNKGWGVENANYCLGMAYYRKGNIKKALAEINKQYRITPNSASLCFMRGLIYWKLGNETESISMFSKAIKLNRRYEPLLTSRKGRMAVNTDVLDYMMRSFDEE
ncbi:MAG: hypothetical protein P9M13_01645 [Candidatus Ancaeobacter aquaticus]|nr:hypothetical protein [Candidatus Ancaeobacter aquaticus]